MSEATSEGKKDEKKLRSRLTDLGVVVTLAYPALIGLFLLSWRPDGCKIDDALHGQTLFFNCMTLNEVGGFLAGLFAPIAFLWLIIATFIQSKELTEQRREIAQTRGVAEEQVKYIAAQTAILEATNLREAQMQGDKELDALLIQMLSWCKDKLQENFLTVVAGREDDLPGIRTVNQLSPRDNLIRLYSQIVRLRNDFERYRANYTIILEDGTIERLKALRSWYATLSLVPVRSREWDQILALAKVDQADFQLTYLIEMGPGNELPPGVGK